MDSVVVGLALRKLRQKRKLTAQALSLSANLPGYTVSRIENAKLNLDFITADALVRVLGITLTELANAVLELKDTPAAAMAKQQFNLRSEIKDIKAKIENL